MLSSWSSDAGRDPTTSDALVDDDTHGLYVLARGLGPEPGRTQVARRAASAAVSLVLRSTALHPRAPLDSLVRLAIEEANAVVARSTQADAALTGVRAVLTMLLIRDGRAVVGHVGHGCVLRVVGGLAVALTEEHTAMGERRRLGYPTTLPSDGSRGAGAGPTLTRSLGERMFVDVDVGAHAVVPGTTYALLSPGFETLRTDGALARIAASPDRARAPARLIEHARAGGVVERLSALLVHTTRASDRAGVDQADPADGRGAASAAANEAASEMHR